MKTILMTAYAVNPYKGSEEGTGWNFICQAARHNRVVAITRKNNQQDIHKYISEHKEDINLYNRITFLYFDLPRWMIAWKKGPLLSALYFYIWQLAVAFWLKRKRIHFDVAHSVNFHSNWTPSFLWILGKPFVWGPVGNHPLIPKQYIRSFYGTQAFLKDRMLWLVKCMFWYLDPALMISRKRAKKVFCVNSQAAIKLRLSSDKIIFMPAVASEEPMAVPGNKVAGKFTVISVGRFVPLKGFDLAINSFASFYHKLSDSEKTTASLVIIGTGPEKQKLQKLIQQHGLSHCITLKEWMPREEVIKQFQTASAFLFPSHEGAGMVVAEALSYKLPVICLDNFGPGEYVHPDTKLKVRQGNYNETVTGLAAALQNIFSDPDSYTREQNLAWQQYNAMFRWNMKGDILNQVYGQLHSKLKTVHITESSKPYVYEK